MLGGYWCCAIVQSSIIVLGMAQNISSIKWRPPSSMVKHPKLLSTGFLLGLPAYSVSVLELDKSQDKGLAALRLCQA